MRIEYLLLENFAMVKSGMGLNRLELDFHKFHKNVITLIVGNNGTGKTGGVLSNLHPFAGLGHLEARDDSDIIIPGKNGHKVIIFTNKDHEYYIEHHYTYQGKKRSRKISSYCKKDGKELNPSGSVTSFNLLIETEFQIDLNFLKLMRLGPNVKNFIGLSATDRKSFIAKLLAEVESYVKDQKSASERSSLLSNALKIAIDKKKKLGIDDITTVDDSISEKNRRLKYLQEKKEELIKSFFEYKGSIHAERFDGFADRMREANATFSDLAGKLHHLQLPKHVYLKIDGVDPLTEFHQKINDYQEERIQYASKIAANNTKIGTLQEKYESLDHEIQESKSSMEVTELEEYIAELKKKIDYYQKNFSEKDLPSMTKEELTSDVDKINMILFHLDEILTLPEYTLHYYRDHYQYYENDLNKLDNWAKERLQEIDTQLQLLGKKPSKGNFHVLFLPENCKDYNHCPYYKRILDEQSSKKNKVRKADLLEEQECLEGLSQIAGGLYAIRRILSMRKPGITEYTLDENTILECIANQNKKYFPNPAYIQSLLEKIEFHEEYLRNKKELQDAELRMQLVKKGSKKPYQELVNEQAQCVLEMNRLKDEVHQLEEFMKKIQMQIKATEENIQDYQVFLTYNLKSSEYKTKLREIGLQVQHLKDIGKELNLFEKKEYEYKKNVEDIEFQIRQEEDDIYTLRAKKTMFLQLNDEIEHTQKYYGYAELIRDAVSSKTGIPKVHIMFYCRALKNIANKIISEIFEGELILRDFEITDTKFNIPYYTKGVNVSDIRYGSQAETSVATIAISFAILLSFTPVYNIILLDEVDGPLYDTNKRKFFAAIESELKAIGCEQVFMITQSKMYNDYPVNLIITDPEYASFTNESHSVVFQR